jgi:hypothetical protein
MVRCCEGFLPPFVHREKEKGKEKRRWWRRKRRRMSRVRRRGALKREGEWLEEDGAVVTEVEHASCVLPFGEDDNEPLHRVRRGTRAKKVRWAWAGSSVGLRGRGEEMGQRERGLG